MSDDVKRYEVLVEHPQCGHDTEHWGVRELSNGKYVLHTDYAAIQVELADVLRRCNASQERHAAEKAALEQQLAQAQGELERYKASDKVMADRVNKAGHHLDEAMKRAEHAEARVRELEVKYGAI